MKDCNSIQQHFSEYIDDRLTENLKRVVEAHLGTCPACREEFNALKKVVGHIRDLPETRAPKNFVSELNQRLQPASGFKTILEYLSLPFRFKIPFGFATATAVAVVLIFMIHMEQPQKSMTRLKTERSASRTLEGDAAPEKETVGLPEVSDMATRPVSEPVSPSVEIKKQASPQIIHEKMDHVKDFEMASAPAPTGKGAPNIITWELRVKMTPGEGLSEKPLFKAKDAKPRSIAGMSADNLSVEQEESVRSAGNERFIRDEDDERSPTSMDETVSGVEALTKDLGGNVVSSEKIRSPDPEYLMILTIPVDKMKAFYTELGRMGRFSAQPEELLKPPEDSVTIHLKLIPL